MSVELKQAGITVGSTAGYVSLVLDWPNMLLTPRLAGQLAMALDDLAADLDADYEPLRDPRERALQEMTAATHASQDNDSAEDTPTDPDRHLAQHQNLPPAGTRMPPECP